MVEIIDLSLSEVRNRLQKGDGVIHPRTGEHVRIPVKAKYADVILGISFDNLRLIENQPTRITKDQTSVDHLAERLAILSNGLLRRIPVHECGTADRGIKRNRRAN